MQLLDMNERKMSKEDKLRLEIMRTMMSGKGFNLRDPLIDYDFRSQTNAFKMADCILKRFDVEFKDEKEGKIFWPEKDLKWTGKDQENLPPVAAPAPAKPAPAQVQNPRTIPAMPDDPLADVGFNGEPTSVPGTDSPAEEKKSKGTKKRE